MQKNDNNNGSNGSAKDENLFYIGDRTFKKTKLGLDEEEVRTYVDELISQRDSLKKRQDHLTALTELAEKTVIEANNLSQEMMKKSTEQAKTEADKIKAAAEEDAQQIIEAKKAEAKEVAEKEAEAIKAEAEQQVKQLLDEQLEKIQVEAATVAQKLQGKLLADIEELKKHVISIGSKFEATVPESDRTSDTTSKLDVVEENPEALSEKEKGALLDRIPWLEVEVMPPLDIEKIMDLISRLESLPEVKTTDLLPETPNPLIRIFLNEPSPLAELLKTLPQVEQVTELSDPDDFDEDTGDKRERIQIVLGDNYNNTEKSDKRSTANKSAS